MFDNCTLVTDYSYCFGNCTSLTTAPSFSTNTAVTDFSACFYGCTSLTTAPSGMFDNCTLVTDYSYCFYYCFGLTGNSIQLWNLIPTPTGTSCYYSCTGLSDYASIPSNWK
jgi:hypothetical protein